MLRLRSCASSTMMVSYAASSGSPCVSASRMPSVISLTNASGFVWSAKRTLYPTASAAAGPSSWAIRAATVRAAMRRGCVWPISPRVAATERDADLRQLRRLAGSGFAADDDHRVVANGGSDLVGALRDGQLGGVRNRRTAGGALGAALHRTDNGGGDLLPFGDGRLPAARPLDATRQRQRVGGHGGGKLREEAGGGGRGDHAADSGSRAQQAPARRRGFYPVASRGVMIPRRGGPTSTNRPSHRQRSNPENIPWPVPFAP